MEKSVDHISVISFLYGVLRPCFGVSRMLLFQRILVKAGIALDQLE